jgi:hypothetical protein
VSLIVDHSNEVPTSYAAHLRTPSSIQCGGEKVQLRHAAVQIPL